MKWKDARRSENIIDLRGLSLKEQDQIRGTRSLMDKIKDLFRDTPPHTHTQDKTNYTDIIFEEVEEPSSPLSKTQIDSSFKNTR